MLRFEWDQEKDETNRSKHRIGFETAKLVFDDPHCLTFVKGVEAGQERWHAIGVLGPDDIIRIVSARRADPQERKQYAEAL